MHYFVVMMSSMFISVVHFSRNFHFIYFMQCSPAWYQMIVSVQLLHCRKLTRWEAEIAIASFHLCFEYFPHYSMTWLLCVINLLIFITHTTLLGIEAITCLIIQQQNWLFALLVTLHPYLYSAKLPLTWVPPRSHCTPRQYMLLLESWRF